MAVTYSPFSLNPSEINQYGSQAALAAAKQMQGAERLLKLQQSTMGVGPSGKVADSPYLSQWRSSVGALGGSLPHENALVGLARRLSQGGRYQPRLEAAISDFERKYQSAYGQQRFTAGRIRDQEQAAYQRGLSAYNRASTAANRIRDQEQASYQRGVGAYNEALTAARQHDPNF